MEMMVVLFFADSSIPARRFSSRFTGSLSLVDDLVCGEAEDDVEVRSSTGDTPVVGQMSLIQRRPKNRDARCVVRLR